ncbi:MAG TPA: glycine cleavage T C-terminal barrel domain-containing protein [Solirubrobacteraceae bacterium]|jgi:folate-binding protein YgfZ|nr:glycine cleavage T C-terminal barrel domain-containing protein [Solirubrobacteraceae bacterium]
MAATLTGEYAVLTTGCGLVDRSERGKLALTGADAKEFLNGQVTNDVLALEPGKGCYAAFLTHKGKMLGDVRVLDAGGELLLDTERVALQALFDMVRRFSVGYDVQLHKRTLERALLSLAGPRAREVVPGLPAEEHAHVATSVGGAAVRAIATFEGVDVLCAAEDADAVRAALVEAGAVAVSEEAAEVVRVESGRPRYGVDMDDGTIPEEAALNARAVSFTKGCYVGQETVARLHWKGKPNRRLRGLRLTAPAARGEELRLGEKVVGRVGSAVTSPVLGPIALAIVRREASVGDVLAVGAGAATAEVVELPFAPEPAA